MISDNKPLAGLSILVTRAAHQSDVFAHKLKELGASTTEVPVIAIRLPDDCSELDRRIRQASQYDWLIFASVNAVDFFFQRAKSIGATLARPLPQIAVIGGQTAQAVEARGHHVRYHPSKFVAETFVSEFPGYPRLGGLRMLWPKANIGRMLIAEALSQAGAQVDTVVCYCTTLPEDCSAIAAELHAALPRVDVITVASAQTAKNLASLLQMSNENAAATAFGKPVVAIGPQTAQSAREAGFDNVYEAEVYTLDGLIAQLKALAAQLAH